MIINLEKKFNSIVLKIYGDMNCEKVNYEEMSCEDSVCENMNCEDMNCEDMNYEDSYRTGNLFF